MRTFPAGRIAPDRSTRAKLDVCPELAPLAQLVPIDRGETMKLGGIFRM